MASIRRYAHAEPNPSVPAGCDIKELNLASAIGRPVKVSSTGPGSEKALAGEHHSGTAASHKMLA